jgi:hypothetical protein
MTLATAAARCGLALALVLSACPRQPPRRPQPPVAPPARPPAPPSVDAAISDVATGGSWSEGEQSGILRVVVRGGGRKQMRSDVVVQWLRWDQRSEQPIEVRSATVNELSRGGMIVTATRIEQDDGRPVIRLSVANAVTGAGGEARVWPTGIGRYRVKIKWANEAE